MKRKWRLEIRKTWRWWHKGNACMHRIEFSSGQKDNYEVYRHVNKRYGEPKLVGVCQTLLEAEEKAEQDFQEWLS
jgi:hypothetical protein